MKNWELIAKLAEMPAGADVLAVSSMTENDLKDGGLLDVEDGEEVFSYSAEVVDLDINGKRIYLQLG